MTVDFRFIGDLFRWEKRLAAKFAVTSIGRAVFSMLVIFVMQEFLATQMGNTGRVSGFIVRQFGYEALLPSLAAALFGTYLVSSWLNFVNRIVLQQTVKVIELGTMRRLIEHLLRLSVPYFDSQSHGDLVQAVRHDVSQLRMIVHAVASMILEGVTVLGLLCVLIWLSPKLTFLSLVILPLATIPVVLVSRSLKKRSHKLRVTGYVLFDMVLQMLAGIRVIKVYRGEKTELENGVAQGRRYFDELIEMTRLRALTTVLIESLSGFSVVMIIVAGGLYVRSGELRWPALFAFVMAIRQLHGPVTNLYSYATEIGTNQASAERIREILATKPDVSDRADAVALERPPSSIEFEDVSFGYDQTNAVLSGVSFRVKAGETIGIVGPSGVGKSTLLNLLVRFYDPLKGRVLFDGRDIRDFRQDDLYGITSIVTQEPFLFSTTVRENIRCGRPEASDAEVEEAAKAAYIHETIQGLPKGYDTQIGVGGRELSRGQAQRINVARAILKNSPLLVLDEATSSLDSVAEAEVQKAIDALMRGRTTFVVAHRLSTLRNASRLIVLENGTIAGFGTSEELLASCPLYEKLWKLNRMDEPAGDAEAAVAVEAEPAA